MRLSIIAALSAHRVIGFENRLPWHLPADLKHFKTLTWGKPILMGRKTYESIGKALPGRRNIVVTRNPLFFAPECEVVSSLAQALQLVAEVSEVMLIGGAELFIQALPQADRLYLTLIKHEFAGDCFFPQWSAAEWQESARIDHVPDAQNPYFFSFLTLDRTLKSC